MPASGFHKSLWPEIISRYEAGEEMKAIAEELGVDPKTVYNVARRAGLPNRHIFDADRTRRIVQSYEAGESPRKIAEREGAHRTHVRKLARKAGLPPRPGSRRRYPLTESAFDHPTPIGWWLIGLLAADGHIRTEENLVALTQSEKDIDVLYALYDYLGCPDRPLTELRLSAEAAANAYPRQRAFAARVQSRRLCESLARYGITPRKTKTLVLSSEASSQPAVWLGLLDGDGWVSEVGQRGRPLLVFFGTRAVMRQCSEFWGTRLSFQRVAAPTLFQHARSAHLWGMRLHGANAVRAADLLLAASPVSLRRKRRTLEAIASMADRGGPSAPPRMRTSVNSN